jgi:hypothetical protein
LIYRNGIPNDRASQAGQIIPLRLETSGKEIDHLADHFITLPCVTRQRQRLERAFGHDAINARILGHRRVIAHVLGRIFDRKLQLRELILAVSRENSIFEFPIEKNRHSFFKKKTISRYEY